MHNSYTQYMKTLAYSSAKSTLTVPLILLTVEKIECDISDFVLLSFFLSFFSFMHNSKTVWDIYEQLAHQKTALLSDIVLFWVRAACELRSASYGSKHTSRFLSGTQFCAYIHAQLKN